MKRLLICPSERPAVSFLAEKNPLATVPLLGQTMLEYWLSDLACRGVKQVTVLAHDRPESVRWCVGDGARWGLEVSVLPESRELTPAEALLKYESELEKGSESQSITVIDRLPGLAEPVFESYRHFFSALQQWLPRAVTPDRVGMREFQPGIWRSTRSVISPAAKLAGPCWVGRNVFIGPDAVIGPNTIIEDGAFIEGHTEIAQSCIGPDTFVGRFAQLQASVAWGNTLIDWQTNSLSQVADEFVLCALRRSHVQRTVGWFARLKELYARNEGEECVPWKQLLLNKEG
jgi:NDP-sugar pyrophosphorylase family protein